eukprot:TRINITY_DN1487_c0_g1_i1.p2 TRINITY_DN1487_c0_g1~~TRINITY_DN1487_c0_g1_i1.p2  ORF type:complete len:127 (+),score=33.63 TRINITY_DN1487_c0_g1_i1:94-474(+)
MLTGFFFFFKQKTAYEMLRSLVGSEMCIRDRCNRVLMAQVSHHSDKRLPRFPVEWLVHTVRGKQNVKAAQLIECIFVTVPIQFLCLEASCCLAISSRPKVFENVENVQLQQRHSRALLCDCALGAE